MSRPLAPGVVRTVGTYPVDGGTESYVVDLARGLYLLMYVSGDEGAMDPGTRATYAFEMPPPEMPPVAAGASLSLPVVGIDLSESAAPTGDTHFVTIGEPYDLTIGGCTYSVLDAIYTYDSDPDTTEGYVYFPDLGISFFAWWEGADSQRETYAPVRIGAVR